jgi:hypothetical protein
MKRFVLILVLLFPAPAVFAAVVYQDFEPGNGTPPSSRAPLGAGPEYGWGFNGAVVSLAEPGEPVRSGQKSWKTTIPAGPPVNAGTAIPSQVHTYNVNFVPECHDRLTFWVWSDPSSVGDHTMMVKFFDQDKYKHEGIGVWTLDKAVYRRWTPLTVLFSRLPSDFNLRRVDKIEFFNYWDGTYYYDDIHIGSAASPERDLECLKKEDFVSCLSPEFKGVRADDPRPEATALLGATPLCASVYRRDPAMILEYGRSRAVRRAEGLRLLQRHAYGRF